MEKADGNALFAEEIVAFLLERHIVSVHDNVVDFDADAVGVALPQSIHSILAARSIGSLKRPGVSCRPRR